MAVLVLTNPADLTADLVVTELGDRGLRVVRADIGDMPHALVLSGHIGGQHQRWAGRLAGTHHTLDLGDVDAVYYRRPTPPALPDATDYERRWIGAETRYGLGGILASLECRWLSHPHRMAAAEYKPWQLQQAAACGLRIPPTLITNDPSEARAFVAASPGGAVYKPLHATIYVDEDQADRPVMAVPTKLVEVDQLGDEAGVDRAPHLFQHWVPKDHEVRVTVVDGRLFAVRIDAGSDAARIDWRTDYDALSYRVVDLPADVAAGVLALVDRLGLHYGALDFVVEPGGEYTFLEINPNGQWGWLADELGLPIAAAIADYLQGTS